MCILTFTALMVYTLPVYEVVNYQPLVGIRFHANM